MCRVVSFIAVETSVTTHNNRSFLKINVLNENDRFVHAMNMYFVIEDADGTSNTA